LPVSTPATKNKLNSMARKRSHRPKSPGKDTRATERIAREPVLPAASRLSKRKKLLFAAIATLATFCFVELLLWVVGVAPSYYQIDPYAGFSTHIPHFIPTTDDEGREWLTVAPSKKRVLNQQRFLAKKPAGTYRIVCAGGSTTYGRPFFDWTSWVGWVRALLPIADRQRDWEVINVGAISYASYRAANLMEEMAQYEPDLFIVYTGHNEFLERRTFRALAERPSTVTDLLALASHTRTSTLVRKALGVAGVRQQERSPPATQLGQDVRAISINAVGPEAYHRDPQLAGDVERQFRAALERMTRIASRASADLLLVVPASNLLDFAPFKSQHPAGLDPQRQAQWQNHFEKARSLFFTGRLDPALAEMAAAEKIDNRYAELLYLKGKSLGELERYEPSEQALLRARDEDICPLRAVSPLVEVVREVVAAHGKGAVDFEQIVRQHSEHGLPGRAMFHDHVHPTMEANRLLGVAIVENLQQRGIVRRDDTWNEQAIAQVADQIQSQIDRPLCARQLRALASLLASLGQPDQAAYQAELSLQLSGRTPAALRELANGLRAQRAWKPAAGYYQELLTLASDDVDAHLNLGLCWLAMGREQEGAEQLRAAVQLKPDLAVAHSRLGVWLAGQGQLAEAEKHLTASARLLPNEAVSHSNLGLAIARQGRYREALTHYQQALSLDPDSSSAHYNLGLALEQLGRREDALSHYKATLRSNPNHQGARTRLRKPE
jgi:tetratricopeptide (TPR) repeat protein